MTAQTHILNLIKRIRSIADVGLLYSQDDYDRERYRELQEIHAAMLSALTDQPVAEIAEAFPFVKDYPTAKVDVRGLALSPDGKLLLVKERADSRWSLPGGWADVGFSPKEVIIKEFKEETGLDVIPERLLAIFDKKMHAHPSHPHYVYKIVFLCAIISTEITKGFDVLDVQYFDRNLLPDLSEDRILKSQIEILVEIVRSGKLVPYVD